MPTAAQDAVIGRVRRNAARTIVAVAGLAMLCNVGALAVPLFNMQVFNRVMPTRDIDTLLALGAGLALCLLAWAALEYLRSVAQELLAGRVARTLALPLIQAASVAPRPDHAAAEIMADLETVRGFVAGRACMAPFDIVWSPVLVLVLVAMHWGLAALATASMLLLIGLNVIGDIVSRHALMRANEASSAAVRGAADGVAAAEAVLALGMLPVLLQRWQVAQARATRLVEGALLRARAVSAATSALRAGMTGAMVALGLTLALGGLASSGSMVAGNMILARLLMPFTSIAATRRQWVDAYAAWRRIKAALEDSRPRRNTGSLPIPVPHLSVENLSYLPPRSDRPLLRGVTFAVEPGEAVAIIGPSSAGKSTLLRLIVGMASPTAGGAYLDGNSTFLWEREDFARHVGYMPQRPALLDETVADNIARMQDATVDQIGTVVAASKRVGLHQAIAGLPHGYSTVVTGNILSGGQRQRLALARALHGNPRLLVLDEPSASLDPEAEADLLRLFAALRADGVTLVVATHRPPLLAVMDKVLVLREGSIAHFGPADEFRARRAKQPIRLVRATQDIAPTAVQAAGT